MKTKIELESGDWGQIIDGLTCRAELYEDTTAYYEGDAPVAAIAEVSDVEEARELAAKYRSLIDQIQSQRR